MFFLIFGCWLLPEKFTFCPKNNGFARVRGAAAPWLVRLRSDVCYSVICSLMVMVTSSHLAS